MSGDESSDYRRGYNTGYERGASAQVHAHVIPMKQREFWLAWALYQIEKHDMSPEMVNHIAWLRTAYRLDLVGSSAKDYRPQWDRRKDDDE